MKSIFLALLCVVLAYAQVITFSNEFAPTYEGKPTTSLIRVKNTGKFFENGKNAISTIKFRISIDSAKPKSASAQFNPVDDKFFGAIVGEADGFFYFNVLGLNGTYQCQLHMKYIDSKGKSIKADPYRFTFTILKKNTRDVVGRVRPDEETEVVLYDEKTMIETVAEEGSDLQSRQTGVNPDCPTPSSTDGIWQGCNLASYYPQPTANGISVKNQLPSGTGTYPVWANITYSFTGVSPSTTLLITQAPTTIFKNGIGTIYLNITSTGTCNTFFTFTMNYKKASGGTVGSLIFQPGNTVYAWTTTFNPVSTVAAPNNYCP